MWFLCIRLVGQGRSVVEMAKELKVKWETAARIQRRLAIALSRPGLIQQLHDILEKGDEDGSHTMGVSKEFLRSWSGARHGMVRRGNRKWTEGS
jgi:hypothetical protein